MKNMLKLCVLTSVALYIGACGLFAGKGPIITADGVKVLECVAAHYIELRDAPNVATAAEIVARDCGAESTQVVLDIFGGMQRGLKRSGLKIEK